MPRDHSQSRVFITPLPHTRAQHGGQLLGVIALVSIAPLAWWGGGRFRHGYAVIGGITPGTRGASVAARPLAYPRATFSPHPTALSHRSTNWTLVLDQERVDACYAKEESFDVDEMRALLAYFVECECRERSVGKARSRHYHVTPPIAQAK